MIDKQTQNTYSLIKKMAIILLMVISAGWIPYRYFTASPPRFCEEKNRMLTNVELIIAALENKYKYNAIKIDDSTKTPQDFYKKFPFCCTVERITVDGKTDPGYVYVELYFPTSEKVMSRSVTICDGTYTKHPRDEKLNYTSDGTCTIHPSDKSLNYTKERVPVSDCGDVGSGPSKDLNIKDTPFGNDYMKSLNLLYLELARVGRNN